MGPAWGGGVPTGRASADLGPSAVRARIIDGTLRLLAVGAAVTLPLGLLNLGPVVGALMPVPFLAQYAFGLWLVRRGWHELAAWSFVGSTLLTLPLLVATTGGIRGNGVAFVVTSAMIAVAWLDAKPAMIAVGLHLAGLAWVFHTGGLGTPWFALSADAVAVGGPVTSTLATCIAAGTVALMVEALRAAEHRAGQLTAASEAALARAQEAAAVKTRFLGTMSHELRTPLNAILGYAGMLREEGGPAEPDLARIEQAGRQLLTLVEDLLELSRAEAVVRDGLRGASECECDVGEVVAAAWEPPPLVRRRGPISLVADPSRVARLVRNLLAHHRGGDRRVVEVVGEPDAVKVVLESADLHGGVALVVTERLAAALGASVRPGDGSLTLLLPRRR